MLRVVPAGRSFARYCMYTEAGKFRCFDEGWRIAHTNPQQPFTC